jgi:hypothetical protein
MTRLRAKFILTPKCLLRAVSAVQPETDLRASDVLKPVAKLRAMSAISPSDYLARRHEHETRNHRARRDAYLNQLKQCAPQPRA